jgi:hypothetical protein
LDILVSKHGRGTQRSSLTGVHDNFTRSWAAGKIRHWQIHLAKLWRQIGPTGLLHAAPAGQGGLQTAERHVALIYSIGFAPAGVCLLGKRVQHIGQRHVFHIERHLCVQFWVQPHLFPGLPLDLLDDFSQGCISHVKRDQIVPFYPRRPAKPRGRKHNNNSNANCECFHFYVGVCYLCID